MSAHTFLGESPTQRALDGLGTGGGGLQSRGPFHLAFDTPDIATTGLPLFTPVVEEIILLVQFWLITPWSFNADPDSITDAKVNLQTVNGLFVPNGASFEAGFAVEADIVPSSISGDFRIPNPLGSNPYSSAFVAPGLKMTTVMQAANEISTIVTDSNGDPAGSGRPDFPNAGACDLYVFTVVPS